MAKSYKLILANAKGENTYEKEFESFGQCGQALWEKAKNENFAFVIVEEDSQITHIYYLG